MEIPAGYAQANLVFGGASLPTGGQVTLGLEVSGYAGSPNQMAQQVFTDLQSSGWQAETSSGITFLRVDVKLGPTATGPSGTYASGITGSSSSATTPPNTALLVKKTTDFGGRAGRGRMYFPGLAEANVNHDGVVLAGAVTAWQTMMTGWRNKLIISELLPMVLHGVGSPLSTPTPCQAFVVDNKVATQRRRLRR